MSISETLPNDLAACHALIRSQEAASQLQTEVIDTLS